MKKLTTYHDELSSLIPSVLFTTNLNTRIRFFHFHCGFIGCDYSPLILNLFLKGSNLLYLLSYGFPLFDNLFLEMLIEIIQ